jgi:ABC-type uncharacterized transport system ATPase subunit
MDSPAALKRDVLSGPAWNLAVDRLIPAIEAMEQIPGVAQVGLRGDHLHAITQAGRLTAGSLQAALEARGFAAQIDLADPTLEDVFMALAGRGRESYV